MAKNWLIVVVGIAFGLVVGVLAPSIDLGASDNNATKESPLLPKTEKQIN